MAHPQGKLAAIALILLASATGGCESGGENATVGQTSAGGQGQRGAKDPDSATAAEVLPKGDNAPNAAAAESPAATAAARTSLRSANAWGFTA